MTNHSPDKERLEKIKVIALDLDGTLLNDSHEITLRTKGVLQRAVSEGYQVLLASGRSYLGMLPFYKKLELTSPIIAYNGAVVIEPESEKYLFKNYLNEEIVRSAVTIADEEGIYLHVYDGETPIYWGDKKLADEYGQKTSIVPIPHQNWEINWDNCVKAMFLGNPNDYARLKELKQRLDSLSLWEGKAYTIFSSLTYLEILNVSAGKELALKDFIASVGLAPENVCAFGDAINDQGMLQEMGIGVAMANGLSEILETTEFITKSNEDEGVADFIERHFFS